MIGLLTFLTMLVAILLILVVLVQDSKGGGLSSNFSSSNQVMGVKRTSELIEKITWGLVIALFVLCIALTFATNSSTGTNTAKDTELRDRINNAPTSTPAPMPAAPSEGAEPQNAEPAPAN
ncbi:MAG: preprotein translocase subunit SecG [Bacteroidia bacterium]|nr:preprotein translocase subunit SecG [Bacteroidia bacterium]MCZ2248624.1 preprotein translocase subunit SecG [Bacteroidia bacterium]